MNRPFNNPGLRKYPPPLSRSCVQCFEYSDTVPRVAKLVINAVLQSYCGTKTDDVTVYLERPSFGAVAFENPRRMAILVLSSNKMHTT
jgi:hypothetical protein